MLNHLKSRFFFHNIPFDKESAIFYLYDFGGNLSGYQKYTPSAPKSRSNNGRYFTYVSPNRIAVWGLQYAYPTKLMIITEGVFKSCRFNNYNINSIAVLGNNPLQLREQLKLLSLQYKIVIIPDPDKAGTKLLQFSDNFIIPTKPVDDMNESEFESLLQQIYNLTEAKP